MDSKTKKNKGKIDERERNGCSKTRGGFVVFKARKSCRTFCAVMRKPHPDGFLPISSSYWDLFKSNSKGRQSEPKNKNEDKDDKFGGHYIGRMLLLLVFFKSRASSW